METNLEKAIMQQREDKALKAKEGEDESSPIAIIAAIVGNVLIGIVKFIAAGISGSSAMISEGIHSFVDTGDGLLVLYGIKASKKKPDVEHPFGYGKQLYFYTFLVALFIFSVGGGASILKGISAWLKADSVVLGDSTLNYIVCIIGMIIEGATLIIAIRTINKDRAGMTFREYIKTCKDPSNFVILLEDSAAELGLVFAILGVYISRKTGNPRFDAIASIIIGLLLITVAIILLRETKGLLIGEGLTIPEIEDIVELVEGEKAVNSCGRVLSMYLSPNDMLLTLDVSFINNLKEGQVLHSIDSIESKIRNKYPEANRIFIEVESLRNVNKQKVIMEKLIEEAESQLED